MKDPNYIEKLSNKKSIKSIVLIISVIIVFALIQNNTLITRHQLKEYKSLDEKMQRLDDESSKYYSDNQEKISNYLDLRVKYEEIEQSFNEYKEKYPDDLDDDIENAKNEVNEYYAKAIKLENELKKAKEEKRKSQIASSSTSSNSSSNSGNSNNHSHSHNNTSTNKHIGKKVYIANGNSYYHAISNCRYLEGAKTSLVTLTSSMRKYECNCWTNPVVYKPSTSSSSGSSNSGGRIVYIASGNSYYHKSSSCKFIRGASVKAVSINNVGGKYACNCIKY